MARRILLLTAGLAAACGSVIREAPGGASGDTLSFAQYNSLAEGMTAKAIVNAFGQPADILRKNDRVRGITYRCEGPEGKVGELRLVFSPEERLEKWALKAAGAPAAAAPAEPAAKTG